MISCITSAESGGREGPSRSCARALATVTPRGDPQVASQTDCVRHRHLPRAAHPSPNTLPDPHLDPLPRAALAAFFTLYSGIVVYTTVDAMYHVANDARRPRSPAAARRGQARALRAPLDGHLDRRLVELPLATVLPVHLRRVWRAPRRCAAREAGRAARRVWGVRRVELR